MVVVKVSDEVHEDVVELLEESDEAVCLDYLVGQTGASRREVKYVLRELMRENKLKSGIPGFKYKLLDCNT